MQNDLVFDVGAHKGEDTAFYLTKGFRVVAVEANPALCQNLEARFRDEIKMGYLTVLNVAIAEYEGEIDFFANDQMSVWGTTRKDFVERNQTIGFASNGPIKVPCSPLSRLVERCGLPHYCKIDIEGMDLEALRSLANYAPRFVSIESTKASWSDLLQEFQTFMDLGYRKFKVVDQSLIPFQGSHIGHKFEEDSSGAFGDDIPCSWLNAPEAIERYRNIFIGYALNGDTGMFAGGHKSVFNVLGKAQERLFRMKGHSGYINPATLLPHPGWFDTHASR